MKARELALLAQVIRYSGRGLAVPVEARISRAQRWELAHDIAHAFNLKDTQRAAFVTACIEEDA